jgi:putative addiction module component (TIGR02574 family)
MLLCCPRRGEREALSTTQEELMSLPLEKVAEEALSLPEESRAELMARLLRSFDFAGSGPTALSEAWLEEAERRDDEMSKGIDPGIPAEEVFRRLRT